MDPEKRVPVFPRDKREAFARRSCSNKEIGRDDDSKKSHLALGCFRRHCEERSDEAIHSFFPRQFGLLRFARNDDPSIDSRSAPGGTPCPPKTLSPSPCSAAI